MYCSFQCFVQYSISLNKNDMYKYKNILVDLTLKVNIRWQKNIQYFSDIEEFVF